MKDWTTVGRVLTLSLALAGGAAFAQEETSPEAPAAEVPQADLPSASSLFDRHVEAIGGKEKVMAITTRRMTGTLKIFQGNQDTVLQQGIMRLVAKAPNMFIQEIVIPGQSTEVRTFDGKAAWLKRQDGSVAPIEGEELERMVVAARFYAETDYENHFKSIETVEKQDVEGDAVYVVKVEHFSGRNEAFLFSEKSGLLLGVIGTRAISGDQVGQFRRSYEDYSDYGSGVLAPKIVREIIGSLMFEIEFSKIESGIEFPAIERPANIPDIDVSKFQKN